MGRIRVGLIRCDLHGMYYAALMAKHDPIALRDDKIGRGHAAYYYFYTNYDNPTAMMVPSVAGFAIAKVWDENRCRAELMPEIWQDRPEVCDSFEEVSDDVDLVFIADCNGDGSDHLKLARPGLVKGVPTFIDKPFSYDVKDAESLVRLAQEHATPMMSLSMLKEVPAVACFCNRFKEVGTPEFGTIKGGGDAMAGHIHAISFAQRLFGNGVESVECMGKSPLAYIHLDYGKKANRPEKGVVLNCASGGSPHCAMYASVYGALGVAHSPPIGDFKFPFGAAIILKKIKKMVQTGKPQEEYSDMVECIGIAAAARAAQKSKDRVYLRDILK